MKIPFVGASYTAHSLNAAAERTVNCYLEANPSPGREWALYGTPGMTQRATLGNDAHRGCIECGDYTYWIAGSVVWRMDSAFALTNLGNIGTAFGRVGLAANGTEVIIVDGVGGWLATSSALAAISDPDFPNGVTQAAYIDGYFLVAGDGTQTVYWSENPNSGASWDGLDFGSAEGAPDAVIGLLADHRELWVFGSHSAEVWVNTGDADAPFQRSGNTFLETGAASAWTVASMDNSVFWVGSGKDGEGVVFRSQGYSPVRISDHAIETAITGYSDISDAYAFCFQMRGHLFYALHFPTADATWLYDVATQRWCEWLWRDEGTNAFHRHRAACHVFSGRQHLVGDWESGVIYSLDPDAYTDAGTPIKRMRRTQTLSSGGQRLFFEELNVDMETGVTNADCADPQVMLRYSNDGGRTWSTERQRSLGASGQYGRRVKFGPLGSARNRVWELSVTDPVKFALFGADARVS